MKPQGRLVMVKMTRKLLDRSSDLNPRNMRLGMYAWMIQRFSGLFLVFFVLTHITAIAQANFGITSGAQAQIFDVFRNPFYAGGFGAVIFDLIALGIIAFHGMNGIRIVFLDLGFGVRKHRLGFWLTIIVALVASAYVIFLGLPLLARGA
jgi:succinate dehydrogenase / fumarate reductase cytochrome b subunit